MLYGTVVVNSQQQKVLEHVEADKSILEKKDRDCLIKDKNGHFWLREFEQDNDEMLVEVRREDVTDDLQFVEWHLNRDLVVKE
jgi:hypothetical protein